MNGLHDFTDWFTARSFSELLAWGFGALLVVMIVLTVKAL